MAVPGFGGDGVLRLVRAVVHRDFLSSGFGGFSEDDGGTPPLSWQG